MRLHMKCQQEHQNSFYSLKKNIKKCTDKTVATAKQWTITAIMVAIHTLRDHQQTSQNTAQSKEKNPNSSEFTGSMHVNLVLSKTKKKPPPKKKKQTKKHTHTQKKQQQPATIKLSVASLTKKLQNT